MVEDGIEAEEEIGEKRSKGGEPEEGKRGKRQERKMEGSLATRDQPRLRAEVVRTGWSVQDQGGRNGTGSGGGWWWW